MPDFYICTNAIIEAAEAFLSTLDDSHPSVNFTMELAKNSKIIPWGRNHPEHMSCLETKVYKMLTDTGLLLHYRSMLMSNINSHCYKIMMLNTNHAFKLSSNWQLFYLECEHLTKSFSRLQNPVIL